MFKKLIATDNNWAATVARLTLGFVMLPHGLQKTVGLFGGHGFSGTLGFFTEQMGISTLFALLAILAESAGALGLIVGLFSRVAAFGVASVMAVAVVMAHAPNGFFMNWYGNQAGEGFEYHLLAIGLAVVVMIAGGGAASADQKLQNH